MSQPRFEVRPLGAWDRPRTPEPRRATFRVDWEETIAQLKHEVELLDGSVIATQIDVTAGEIRRDGMLRAGAKVGFQGVKVSFDSKHGPLTYATDTFDRWRDNVRAVALGLQALRAVDRYGITRTGEQYRGWTAIAAAPAEKTLTLDEARDILRAASGFRDAPFDTPDNVNTAYRRAARTAHPDAGGNPDAFRLITAARDVLLREFGGGR